jgi:hypothetical protein
MRKRKVLSEDASAVAGATHCQAMCDVPHTHTKTGHLFWSKEPCSGVAAIGSQFCPRHQPGKAPPMHQSVVDAIRRLESEHKPTEADAMRANLKAMGPPDR